ncbi:MAG: hypothetical protein HCA25_00945 [Dolichospermum sp. DET50]|nr:hypothetical protein [Dolichospermum sp. DET66]MBS3030885.1 hypothetical protein [Dolichospermum sp. DET67]MBS3036095.1 hypothetical protein [Dolichospermum sp. DET50]QSX68172.1 MAG: hypothetical protein EZY12_00115 [Dolichospermum sp. DET69]
MTVKQLIQAEIDNIPEEALEQVYQLLKELNKSTKKGMLSLNDTSKTTLQKSEKNGSNFYPYHDLDYLAGTWGEEDETEFLANTKQFNEVDNNLWK